MTNEYKPEEIEFLMERVKRTDYKNIVEEMNKKFDIKRTEDGIRKKMKKLKTHKSTTTNALFLSCSKCQRKLGYIKKEQTPFLIKLFGSLENTTKKYLCKKCRKVSK